VKLIVGWRHGELEGAASSYSSDMPALALYYVAGLNTELCINWYINAE
jgi:hypothetical protein